MHNTPSRDTTPLFFVHNSAYFLHLNLKFNTYFLCCIFNPFHHGNVFSCVPIMSHIAATLLCIFNGLWLKVHNYVRESLPDLKDNSTKPYVMNHGGVGPITAKSIIDRRNEIGLFLSTRYIFWNILLIVIITLDIQGDCKQVFPKT